MAWYCIVFDIIAVYCMSPHCILWYGMVLYFIWSYCTVSHCYVPLLQRAGELPRSASSHFDSHKIKEQFMRQQLSVISTLCRGTLLAVYQYRSSLNGSVAANWVLAAAARKKIYFCRDF